MFSINAAAMYRLAYEQTETIKQLEEHIGGQNEFIDELYAAVEEKIEIGGRLGEKLERLCELHEERIATRDYEILELEQENWNLREELHAERGAIVFRLWRRKISPLVAKTRAAAARRREHIEEEATDDAA